MVVSQWPHQMGHVFPKIRVTMVQCYLKKSAAEELQLFFQDM